MIYFSTKVECAALCLSTPSCYAIDFVSSQCRFMYEYSANFDVDTSQGKMTICLDHQNWNRHEVYLPDDNTPPMCPSKINRFDLYTSFILR